MPRRECEQCGEPFEAHREYAKFCSTRCRVAWNRTNPDTGSAQMTSKDRQELAKVIRARERLAKADVETVAAERMADFEAQLASVYKFDDEAWKDVTATARAAIESGRCRGRQAVPCPRHSRTVPAATEP
jgi:hypothetical protein